MMVKGKKFIVSPYVLGLSLAKRIKGVKIY